MGLFWLHLSTCTLSGLVIGTKTTKLLLGISSIPSLLHLPTPSVADSWRAVRFHTTYQMELAKS
ncbi:hypothetical protein NC652_030110 [Populus alba x Populus x berolinensis]|nr:hypothetical protein NC652_030110 [Populus alba x Populus x berolinensis]